MSAIEAPLESDLDGELLRRKTKTVASDAALPLPDICATALARRRTAQTAARAAVSPAWHSQT